MTSYVETSALLTWLFDQARSDDVARDMIELTEPMTSELTLLEAERALLRAESDGWRTPGQVDPLRVRLRELVAHWHVLRLTTEIIARAGQPFPAEPIRTLDALHLASALEMRAAVPGLAILSLDRRVRESADVLGFDVLP